MTQTIQGSPKEGLLGATVGFFIGFAAVALFGPTAKRIQEVIELTPAMVGLLVAMPSLSGSLLRIPFSAWVDTSGGRKPFLTLLGLSILGMAGLTLFIFRYYPDGLQQSHYPLLLFLGALCGCGIATFSPGSSQVSYWYPQSRQGSALGFYGGISNMAPGLFSFLLPLALNAIGLSGSYLVWLLILVTGTLLYYRLGRNAPFFQYRAQGYSIEQSRELAAQAGQEIFPTGSVVASLKNSARIWKTWALTGIYFTTFGGFVALTAWLPTYWTSFFGVDLVAAGTLTAVFSVSTSLFRVAGGKVADRLGGERTTLLALLVLAAGAGLFALAQTPGLAVAAELVLALGMGVGNAAVFKLVPQAVPQAVGGAAGWVGGLGAFGGFVLPPVLGGVVRSMGQSGYPAGFLLFLGLAGVSLALALLLKRAVVRPETRKPVRQVGD